MTARAPKTMTNSWKTEPGDLWIQFLMFFCRSSILNDGTTIFMVFQVLGVPWKTINSPKLIPIIRLTLCIDKTLPRVRFVSKMMSPALQNCIPNHLKSSLEAPGDPAGDPKVPQSPKRTICIEKLCLQHSRWHPKSLQMKLGSPRFIKFQGPAAGAKP